jgi:hypothetical protein
LTRHSLLALVLAGCFAGGPVPSTGSDAPIVFQSSLPSGCNGTYITSLAFGSDSGYALIYPYGLETDGCDATTPSNVSVAVMQFLIDGSQPLGQMAGAAGMSNMQIAPPQITFGANGPVWAFETPGNPATIYVGSPGVSPQQLGSDQTGDLVGAAGDYIAAASGHQPIDPMSPNYPCCTSGNQQNSVGTLTQYTIEGTQVSVMPPATLPAIMLGELPSAIAANSSAVFYVEPKQPGIGIEALSGGATTELATISQTLPTGSTPVGLAADDQHVAWALAQDATQTPLAMGCQIWFVDDNPLSSTGTVTSLFSSSNLSCMSLAIDPNAVYFTIVDEVADNNNGSQPYLHGVGIGRVDFAMHMFSSIAFDVAALASGPRRIFTTQSDPNDVFVVDPLVVAKISKMSFAGRTDISP